MQLITVLNNLRKSGVRLLVEILTNACKLESNNTDLFLIY